MVKRYFCAWFIYLFNTTNSPSKEFSVCTLLQLSSGLKYNPKPNVYYQLLPFSLSFLRVFPFQTMLPSQDNNSLTFCNIRIHIHLNRHYLV